MTGIRLKYEKLDSVAQALAPPVTLDLDIGRITVTFDPGEWVLVPRGVMVLNERQRRRFSQDTARRLAELHGYDKRDPWTKTLTEMLLVYASDRHLSKLTLLVRVTHLPGEAPGVNAAALSIVDGEGSDLDELAVEMASAPQRREPETRWHTLRSGKRAFTVTRYFALQDADPYVSVLLMHDAGPRFAAHEVAVSHDEEADEAVRLAVAAANAHRIELSASSFEA